MLEVALLLHVSMMSATELDYRVGVAISSDEFSAWHGGTEAHHNIMYCDMVVLDSRYRCAVRRQVSDRKASMGYALASLFG